MNPSILVAEDSPTQAGALREVLERNSFRVLVASDGETALSLARRERPDIVISDVIMPKMDGFELCTRIKADDALKRTPVILLTALSDAQDVVRGLESGADVFVTKPYDEKHLMSRLRYVLDNPAPKEPERRQKEVVVTLDNRSFSVSAGRRQILDLLLSSYEAAVYKNRELARSEDELLQLNDQLAGKVEELQRSEEALQRARDELEQRVLERTSQIRTLALELTQAESRERKHLATILHDHLQQLLVAAKFSAEIAQKKAAAKDLQDVIQKVFDLLDESISVSRSLTVELSPPVLYEGGIGAALKWLARWMKEKYGLSVEVLADSVVPPDTEGVSNLLYQSIRELLFNVVKHAGVREAQVRISVADGSRLKTVVSDNGVGFDVAQGRAQRTQSSFGLFSVQERLGLLGGEVTIESAPGRGTRVTLFAPLPAALRPGVPRESVAVSGGDGASSARQECGDRIRILVADDQKFVRAGLVEFIRAESDMEVVAEASDGLEAVEMARRLRPEVILMDLSMPKMNGLEATEKITAEMPDIRVIGLSMYDKADYQDFMRKSGAAAYLTKDGPSRELITTIRAVCRP